MANSKLFTVAMAVAAISAAAYPMAGVGQGAEGMGAPPSFGADGMGAPPSFGAEGMGEPRRPGPGGMGPGPRFEMSEQCSAAMATACPACPVPRNSSASATGLQLDDQCATQCSNGQSDECDQCREAMGEQCRQCVESNADSLIAAGCTQVACMRLKEELCPVCEPKDASCRQCRPEDTTEACVSCNATMTACRTCLEQNSAELEGQCGQMQEERRMRHGPGMQTSEQCSAAMATACPACPVRPTSPGDATSGQQANDECATQCSNGQSDECDQCREAMGEQCRQCVDSNADSLIAAGCTQVACMRLKEELCPVCEQKDTSCRQCRRGDTSETCVNCNATMTACRTCLEQNSAELEGQCGQRQEERGMRHGPRTQISEECSAAMTTTCSACPVPPTSSAEASSSGQQPNDECAAQCSNGRSDECDQCREAAGEQCRQCVEANADSLIAAGCTHVACMLLKEELCPVCEQKDASCRQCRPGNTSEICTSCNATMTACRTCLEQNSAELEAQCGVMEMPPNPRGRDMDMASLPAGAATESVTSLEQSQAVNGLATATYGAAQDTVSSQNSAVFDTVAESDISDVSQEQADLASVMNLVEADATL